MADIKAGRISLDTRRSVQNLKRAAVPVPVFSKQRKHIGIGFHHHMILRIGQPAIYFTGNDAKGRAELDDGNIAPDKLLCGQPLPGFADAF